jgi:hypothetical protein
MQITRSKIQRPRLGSILLSILTMIALSGATFAEVHHVEDCTVCHYGLGGPSEASLCKDSANLKMVREEIETPNSGTKQVTFTGPYVRGENPYDGVCEVCHTQTLVHTNTGDGVNHYDGKDCILCHPHAQPGEMFSTAECYGPESHHTHIRGNKGPEIGDCTDCHLNHANYMLFADGEPLASTTACDNCHSSGGTYGGAAIAKANWDDGVYVADGTALQSGKEQWCAGCHDDEPANSKKDGSGVDAPNIIGEDLNGDDIPDYGYYASGHGRDTAKLTCDVCHDLTRPHIDGNPKTYEVDESTWLPAPENRLAVINSYNDGYRLNAGLVVPTTSQEPQLFSLCTNCHMSVLGTVSNFRFDKTPVNYLHGDHISISMCWAWDSDADGQGGSACNGGDSGVSCPACHNVHGSPMDVSGTLYQNPVMVSHGELTNTVPGLNFRWYTDGYGGSQGGVPTSDLMASQSGAVWCNPPSCAVEPCHGTAPYYKRTPLEIESGIVVDDFESYNSDASLQDNWTNAEDAKLPFLEPQSTGVTGPDGSQCMRVRIVWTQTTSSYGTAKRSYDPYVDLRTANSISFYVNVKNTAKIEKIVVRLKKYPEATFCEATLSTSGLQDDVWGQVSFPRASFDDATWGKLSEIQFQIHEYDPEQSYAQNVFFDDIRFKP